MGPRGMGPGGMGPRGMGPRGMGPGGMGPGGSNMRGMNRMDRPDAPQDPETQERPRRRETASDEGSRGRETPEVRGQETAMSAAQRTVLKEAGVMRVKNRTVIVGRALRRKLRSDRLSYISIVLRFANVSLRDVRELFLDRSLFVPRPRKVFTWKNPSVHRLASAGVPCSALEPERKTKPPHRSLPE